VAISQETDDSAKQTIDSESEINADEKILQKLNIQLRSANSEFSSIADNMREIEEQLKIISSEAVSLKNQIQSIDFTIAHTELKIMALQKQISFLEGDIAAKSTEILRKEKEIESLKKTLFEYLQLIYVTENSFLDDSNEDDFINKATKILFSDSTITEISRERVYFMALEEQSRSLLGKIDFTRNELLVLSAELIESGTQMEALKADLSQDLANYESQKAAKETLLAQTQGKEEIFLDLLAQSKAQQEEILVEMASLRTNYAKLRLQSDYAAEFFEFDESENLISEIDFRWPVSPNLGISAYFMDESYVGVFGVNHRAIDIPVAQGTPLRAAEKGVVYKAKDNGYGYSYIVLAHKDGYTTLYGHVSKIEVIEGQIVEKGEVIGFSGGAPGTPGAGYMTTGAHLHFEIMKGGKHLDPLSVLPLSQLNLRFIPQKYLEQKQENITVQ
jgi:murein DD-endopeptidase MepM/ murein hydrolase activator NlpD